nr:MAG TPA: hypothetical protein [Caudoviricetes sp.]
MTPCFSLLRPRCNTTVAYCSRIRQLIMQRI